MRRLLFHIVLLLSATCAFGQSSVLGSGKWYKIGVSKTGVYRISSEQFRRMGFDAGSTDPRTIHIYGLRGGMLPQSNAMERPADLVELSIEVIGESDGVLNPQDYILFYAEGPHKELFNASRKIFHIEQNLYSDVNYYFLTVGNGDGKRVAKDSPGTGGIVIDSFQDFIWHETDEHNELRSGREWFGERFDLTSEHSFQFDIEGIMPEQPLYFVSDVMAQSANVSTFRILFNGYQVGEQPVPVTPSSTYGVKGRHKRDTFQIMPGNAGVGQNLKHTVTYSFTRGSSGRSIGYLNFFSCHFTRALKLYGDQTRFRNSVSTGDPIDYRVSAVSTDNQIWNISDPYTPRKQEFLLEGSIARFSASPTAAEAAEFIVFNSRFPSPDLIGSVENQNLRGLDTPHYLIITNPAFLTEANRLAGHRKDLNSWNTAVVTTDEIFNEFSSGRQDVTAIRDFIRHLYKKNPERLKAVLLFGKCSYDYKDRIEGNTNFVPTYESRNSLSPLETYSSDDYFGFMEDNEGEWGENNFLQAHTLDVGIGRFPVKTLEEAKSVVDKLIAYDNAPDRFGKWRKDIVFVADDGSNSDGFTSIHQAQANILADQIESLYPQYNTRKLFLGVYPKIVTPNGESIPRANEDLEKEFSQSVIINYTGHGAEKLWADERILTESGIRDLSNSSYPFLVTATCEFGRHDDPREVSGAELSVLKNSAGSIGLVTTARPVNSSTNFSLNAAFYDAMFALNPFNELTIGEIFKHTKNNSTSGVANRNFSLLGDPGMRLALPKAAIKIDEIKTITGSDTLKALSTVRVKGRVEDANGNVNTLFNGTVHATLFDKRTQFVTTGKNDPPFSFQQWFNPLFRGEASVVNGAFEMQFILPRNIAYEINPGKLSVYASDTERTRDVAGAAVDFKIGGSETPGTEDNTSPDLQVFLGDTTFTDGGIVSPDTKLVVKTFDESGINISNYGIGNTMTAVLDSDAEVFIINDYYHSQKDDFRKGWIHYPLRDLSPGEHTITVKIWDTFNNPAQKSVRFRVSKNDQLVIDSFNSYPNPLISETTFIFAHNRPGEDLDGTITLLNMAGQQLKVMEFTLLSSTYEVQMDLSDLIEAKKLPPGVYFGRLRIRSLSDGRRTERVTKLIVLN